jgi:AraC family transcriptional regulator
MEPRIETLESKRLVGLRLKMSLAENRTRELWQTFMPRRNEATARVGSHFVSMQVFDREQGDPFSPESPFEKWAAVEVAPQVNPPEGMETYTLAGGKYAVFTHRGPASEAPATFHKIFGIWLPNSGYALDAREHFEILPPDYRPDDPEATEEIWIPIR